VPAVHIDEIEARAVDTELRDDIGGVAFELGRAMAVGCEV
jgi:hypothetical protein